MEKTQVTFEFLKSEYEADIEYFEPPGVMPYFKAVISDAKLSSQFGSVHNFKEEVRNGWVILKPTIDPQGKFHAYFWTCIMASIYILLLDHADRNFQPQMDEAR
jgi:hypothetical protein